MGLDWWMESIVTEKQEESWGSCLNPEETTSGGNHTYIFNALALKPEPGLSTCLQCHNHLVFLTLWPPQQKTCCSYSFKNDKILPRDTNRARNRTRPFTCFMEKLKAQAHWAESWVLVGIQVCSQALFLFTLPKLEPLRTWMWATQGKSLETLDLRSEIKTTSF